MFSTFVCPTEIIAFSDKVADFKALNAEVVGVSTDSHFSHLAWINASRKVNLLITEVLLLVITLFNSLYSVC